MDARGLTGRRKEGVTLQLVFRLVEADDPRLLALTGALDSYYEEKYGALARSYRAHHDLTRMTSRLVAEIDGQPAACGCWRAMEDGAAEIKRIYVRPEYRRQGAARNLLRALETDAARQGITRAVLETGAEEFEAQAFYQSCGYAFCEPYGVYVGDENCVAMDKRL